MNTYRTSLDSIRWDPLCLLQSGPKSILNSPCRPWHRNADDTDGAETPVFQPAMSLALSPRRIWGRRLLFPSSAFFTIRPVARQGGPEDIVRFRPGLPSSLFAAPEAGGDTLAKDGPGLGTRTGPFGATTKLTMHLLLASIASCLEPVLLF